MINSSFCASKEELSFWDFELTLKYPYQQFLGISLQKYFHKVSENKAIKNFSLQHNYNSWILKTGKRVQNIIGFMIIKRHPI
jgi:hypothetical protein|tara:strand:- start:5157 stop:5402 length:246 start_codon:yes stop_codon:yes gene_type:complete